MSMGFSIDFSISAGDDFIYSFQFSTSESVSFSLLRYLFSCTINSQLCVIKQFKARSGRAELDFVTRLVHPRVPSQSRELARKPAHQSFFFDDDVFKNRGKPKS